jgi:hypothetical protein
MFKMLSIALLMFPASTEIPITDVISVICQVYRAWIAIHQHIAMITAHGVLVRRVYDLNKVPTRTEFFCLFVCLFVLSRTSNFSAIWRLSPLPATGLQI